MQGKAGCTVGGGGGFLVGGGGGFFCETHGHGSVPDSFGQFKVNVHTLVSKRPSATLLLPLPSSPLLNLRV